MKTECIDGKKILLGVWRNTHGYYQIHDIRRGKIRTTMTAQRHVWQECFGVIPHGKIVLHKCDNRQCVNPEHLKLGTYADNSRDMKIKGRSTRGEKHAMSKLTSAQVKKIRSFSREERSSRSLASEFGVTKEAINNIRSGRSW